MSDDAKPPGFSSSLTSAVQGATAPSVAGALPRLRAEGICFAWRGRPLLRGVELELFGGETVALLGQNGAGKTTLIRLLTGALEPQAGRIWLDRFDLAEERRAYLRRTGSAGAGDRGLYARLDVQANIELALALALIPRSGRRDLISRALARFELEPLAGIRVGRLSTGQRQRVRLAICFAHEPWLVLLDEPVASLDPDGIELLARAIESACSRGASTLWAGPSVESPQLPADRSLELTQGMLR